MATHSSILAWRIPWTEELGGLQSTGCKESDMTERLHLTSPQSASCEMLGWVNHKLESSVLGEIDISQIYR